MTLRNLVVVCGDQLDHHSAALDGFDPERDAILMTEAAEEARFLQTIGEERPMLWVTVGDQGQDRGELVARHGSVSIRSNG